MPTVMVVEDDEDSLIAIDEALTEEGWQVVAVGSVRDALAAARVSPVELVLCDWLLSDADGPVLQAAFRREVGLRRIPFLFMTAAPRDAERAGARHILAKPFGVQELVSALERRLAEEGGAVALDGAAALVSG